MVARSKHLYPGGNTCHGFYSFYDYMVSPQVERKIVLKGGPGVGKSTFMKKLGEDFANAEIDVEFHWCSSDNESLDGVVIGRQQFCVVDGTAPHRVVTILNTVWISLNRICVDCVKQVDGCCYAN